MFLVCLFICVYMCTLQYVHAQVEAFSASLAVDI